MCQVYSPTIFPCEGAAINNTVNLFHVSQNSEYARSAIKRGCWGNEYFPVFYLYASAYILFNMLLNRAI